MSTLAFSPLTDAALSSRRDDLHKRIAYRVETVIEFEGSFAPTAGDVFRLTALGRESNALYEAIKPASGRCVMDTLATWAMLAAIVIFFAWIAYDNLAEDRRVREREAANKRTLEHLTFVERTGWKR